eukprot:1502624-Prymnesium_polylepis.1
MLVVCPQVDEGRTARLDERPRVARRHLHHIAVVGRGAIVVCRGRARRVRAGGGGASSRGRREATGGRAPHLPHASEQWGA